VSYQSLTTDQSQPRPHRRWYRLALVVTLVLIVFVLVTLPFTLRSMQEVLGRAPEPLFDLVTGEVVSAQADAAARELTYVNLGMVDLNDATGELSLAVSGNRVCGDVCTALDIIFLALDDDAAQRRGLPPSATLSPLALIPVNLVDVTACKAPMLRAIEREGVPL
jgi:hypothetical protein